MAHNCREIKAPPEEVFAVLADPYSYPDWLIGAANIRDADHNWPSPGTVFHHTVGIRPFAIPDVTRVVDVEPFRSLRLSVRARPLVAAEVLFTLVGDGERCTVSIEEEPTLRILGNVVRPLVDPVIHHRNHRSLERLERVVLRRRAEHPVAA